jgi:hypothetical protein
MNAPSVGDALTPPPANNPPSVPLLLFPSDGQTEIRTTTVLQWTKSTDPNGDPISYDLCLRFDNANFTHEDCKPVSQSTALINQKMDFPKVIGQARLNIAGMTNTIGSNTHVWFLLIGIVFAGGMIGRKKKTTLIALLLICGTLLVSCPEPIPPPTTPTPSTSPNVVSYSIDGLIPNKTYFWKIVGKNGRGGVAESAVRRFTTQ